MNQFPLLIDINPCEGILIHVNKHQAVRTKNYWYQSKSINIRHYEPIINQYEPILTNISKY